MNCEKPWNGKLLKAVAVDVYNQTIDGDVACAVTAAVGGANTSGAKVLCVYAQDQGGGCDRDCYGKKAGKGPLVQWEKSGTLGVSQDQTLFVWSTQYKGGPNIDE